LPGVAWLTSQSVWLLLPLCLALALLAAFGSRWAALALIPPHERDEACTIATALMTAFAATFALLTALTLANEASALSSAQSIVGTEAADASALAWASTAPGLSPAPIQTALGTYLRDTRRNEWHGVTASSGTDPATDKALAVLEGVVRTQAARPAVKTATSTELITSLDALTDQRRLRLAAASRQIPDFYAVTVVVTGLALIVNTSVVGIRSRLRPAIVGTSLAVVIGVSIALIFTLATPWRGSISVSGQPIDQVIQNLAHGYFHL
jgi:hypothetical protein